MYVKRQKDVIVKYCAIPKIVKIALCWVLFLFEVICMTESALGNGIAFINSYG
jgi:hypothetical protein